MAERPHPKRGEVWWVKPGKTSGAELQKKRPYVVISADAMGNVPIKIVVPLKTWQDRFADWPWVVRIEPTRANDRGRRRHACQELGHQQVRRAAGATVRRRDGRHHGGAGD